MCVTILQTHPDVLAQYQRWFRYILVDEYQDTNVAQYLWLRLLAQAHRNICCVGDDDQSIYGWRGAEVGNILRFEKDFPGAAGDPAGTELPLDPAYPRRRLGRDRRQRRAGSARRCGPRRASGEKVRLIGHWDGEEEARWIGEEIEALQRGTRGLDPVGLNGMAILVRASHQMRAFEDRFLTIGLPYRVIGGPRFYERQEIRDAMAYFRARRLARRRSGLRAGRQHAQARPRRQGGADDPDAAAREDGVALLDGARACCGLGAASAARAPRRCAAFVEGVDRWHARDAAAGRTTTSSWPRRSSTRSATPPCGRPTRRPRRRAGWKTSRNWSRRWSEFENLQGFLEHVALIMDNEQRGGAPRRSRS